MKRASSQTYGLYQHYNKLFFAGTKDWPNDAIDDLKLPFGDTLDKTARGRAVDAYYRSHHEIDTVIGHSLRGAVALALEQQYNKQGDNPYGIVQSKTFGAPTVSGILGSSLGEFGNVVKNAISDSAIAGATALGAYGMLILL